MITIEKREIKACCGKKQLIIKINIAFDKEHLSIFKQSGFPFLSQYFDAGMIYIEDSGLIATGTLGSNELRIKCKNQTCQKSISKLERIIAQFN